MADADEASGLPIRRRQFLAFGAAAGSAAAAGAIAQHDGMLGGPPRIVRDTLLWADGQADAPKGSVKAGESFLTGAEMAFVTAAADRLIPADATGPSASEAGVPTFLDRQLAGGYGRGEHFYLGGPWPEGQPSQGYQSRLTPANWYRAAIADVEAHAGRAHGGKAFKDLDPADQDALLKDLEQGKVHLDQVDAQEWFSTFVQNVKEGYFSDPIYGGNRNMSAWAMIGFPGAHYDYSEWATRHGERVPFAPVGLTGRPGWQKA